MAVTFVQKHSLGKLRQEEVNGRRGRRSKRTRNNAQLAAGSDPRRSQAHSCVILIIPPGATSNELQFHSFAPLSCFVEKMLLLNL